MKRKLLRLNLLIAFFLSQVNVYALMAPTQDTLSRVQTGSFIAYVEIEPSYDTLDAVIGLSEVTAVSPSEMSAVVNCNKGVFQVYRGDGTGGGSYDRDSTVLSYDSIKHTLKFDVNVIDKTYSVSISSDSLDGEVIIAENYPFRYQADTLAFVSGMYFGEDSLVVSDVWTEWESWPLAAPVNGAFVFEWDVTPTEDVCDVLLALSEDFSRTYGDYSPIVVFTPGWGNNEVKARNGDTYEADTVLGYVKGTSYHVVMKVNVETNTYDVIVTPEGGGDYKIATDYAFRKQAAELKYWGYKDNPADPSVELLDISSTNEDNYSWKLDIDEPLTGNFSIEFDATAKTDVVDEVIFFSDNMPLSEWWANVSAGIVFGGQGTHNIKVRNGDMYEADSLITFGKDSPIHFKVDLFVDVADNANNVYSVTATKEGGDPIVIASDYAFRNPAANIAYYFVKDFSTPQLLDEVLFENFEVLLAPEVPRETHDTLARTQTGSFIAHFELIPSGENIDAVVGLSKSATENFPELSAIVSCDKSGVFKAYKGDGTGAGGYENDTALVYVGGAIYAVEIDVDIISKSYSVTISSESMTAEVMIAENYPFRNQADTLAFLTGINPIAGQSLGLSNLYTEWESWPLAATVNGALVMEWDVVPTDTVVDALLGLSDMCPRTYGDYSPIVIFSPGWGNYEIKVRNGDTYDADTVLTYEIGTSYHIRMKVNVESNTYDVIVTPEGGGDYMLASEYAFRKAANELKYWGYKDNPADPTVELLNISSTLPDMFSWTLGVDEPLTGDFSIEFDATAMYDFVDCFIFFNDNMPFADWWSHINAGIVFGGQGTQLIKVRNGAEYMADSLLSYTKDQKIHFKVDFHVDTDNSANNVYSVTATVDGEDPVMIARDYAFRNPGENIAYYFVKDFETPQLLDEMVFENFEWAVSTGIRGENKVIDGFGLSQNYPNPFSQLTNISYSVVESGHVRLEVYSLSGVKVATLVDADVLSGSYTVEFDASKLESGMYLYKLETGNYTSVRRMIVVD